ncbi:hypothetical protein ABH973_000714 [Bradyrhizobium ottawaense]
MRVFLQARMEDHGECMLVLIGATPEGKKELIGFQVGVRESTQSWRELLIDVMQRGLQIAPEIVGDGALGFWKALDEACPGTRHQRCWVHKTVNVLDKVPLSVQANMKTDLREIYRAPNRAAAEAAIDVFAEKYRAKYGRAVECLTKDRDALLTFYDFPAEHWDHLRTTDEMDKRFLRRRDDDCGDRCKSILLFGCAAGHSSVPATDLAAAARRGGQGWPHLRPPEGLALTDPSTAAHWQWNGTAFLARTCHQPRLWLLGAGDLVAKRDASAASVTGLSILSCRTEALASHFLRAATSIAT